LVTLPAIELDKILKKDQELQFQLKEFVKSKKVKREIQSLIENYK